MSVTTPPSLRVSDLPERRGSRYPAPFHEPCMRRVNRNLGDPFGLKDFGAHLLTLEPGGWSSQRHWHTHEDELVYVLEGTPTLITDEGATPLAPGAVAGFAAGTGNGHHIVNNSDVPAKLLVVGSRKKEDDCYYSDIDMQLLQHASGGVFAHRNGEPY